MIPDDKRGAEVREILKNGLIIGAVTLSNLTPIEYIQYVIPFLKAEKLKEKSTLTSLSITGGQLDQEGMRLLADNLPNTLEILSVKEMPLNADAVTTLMEKLPNTNLGILTLANTDMGPTGAKALAEHLPKLTLGVLNLNDNNLGPEGIKALAEALPHIKPLYNLALENNHMGLEGAKALATVLPRLQSKFLTLGSLSGGNDVDNSEGVKTLIEAFQINKTLKTLYWYGIWCVDIEAQQKIDKILERNNHLPENLIQAKPGIDSKLGTDMLLSIQDFIAVSPGRSAREAQQQKKTADALSPVDKITNLIKYLSNELKKPEMDIDRVITEISNKTEDMLNGKKKIVFSPIEIDKIEKDLQALKAIEDTTITRFIARKWWLLKDISIGNNIRNSADRLDYAITACINNLRKSGYISGLQTLWEIKVWLNSISEYYHEEGYKSYRGGERGDKSSVAYSINKFKDMVSVMESTKHQYEIEQKEILENKLFVAIKDYSRMQAEQVKSIRKWVQKDEMITAFKPIEIKKEMFTDLESCEKIWSDISLRAKEIQTLYENVKLQYGTDEEKTKKFTEAMSNINQKAALSHKKAEELMAMLQWLPQEIQDLDKSISSLNSVIDQDLEKIAKELTTLSPKEEICAFIYQLRPEMYRLQSLTSDKRVRSEQEIIDKIIDKINKIKEAHHLDSVEITTINQELKDFSEISPLAFDLINNLKRQIQEIEPRLSHPIQPAAFQGYQYKPGREEEDKQYKEEKDHKGGAEPSAPSSRRPSGSG